MLTSHMIRQQKAILDADVDRILNVFRHLLRKLNTFQVMAKNLQEVHDVLRQHAQEMINLHKTEFLKEKIQLHDIIEYDE